MSTPNDPVASDIIHGSNATNSTPTPITDMNDPSVLPKTNDDVDVDPTDMSQINLVLNEPETGGINNDTNTEEGNIDDILDYDDDYESGKTSFTNNNDDDTTLQDEQRMNDSQKLEPIENRPEVSTNSNELKKSNSYNDEDDLFEIMGYGDDGMVEKVPLVLKPRGIDDDEDSNNNDDDDDDDDNDDDDDEEKHLIDILKTLKTRVDDLESATKATQYIVSKAKERAIESSFEGLDEDVFTLMVVNDIFAKSWWFGLITFILQMSLLIFIFVYQVSQGEGSTPFDIPFSVSAGVRVAQFLAILVSIMLSKDVVMPIKELSMLWITNREEWTAVIRNRNANWKNWIVHILAPNLLKFCEGCFVLIISFVIIIQRDNVIDLFKDFAAMQLIAEIDNVAFWLAHHGYFGGNLKNDTTLAKRIRVKDEVPKICFGLPLRPVILVSLLLGMIVAFIPFVVWQENGTLFHEKYPSCDIPKDKIPLIGNDKSNGGVLNTVQCGFDGGDCIDFNLAYPDCDVLEPYKVGDGNCDSDYNKENCAFDGGDCCPVRGSPYLGDNKCHAGLFNIMSCNNDNTDCDEFRKKFPDCPEVLRNVTDKYGMPIVIGDGNCIISNDTAYLMTEECGYSDGDCKDCQVNDHTKLGDGHCDGGEYNTKECNFDAGDCMQCNEALENMNLDYSKIGDGICNGKEYGTIEECNLDGGDCADCNAEDYFLIGNGICNGQIFMFEGCNEDGGDCKNCNVEDKSKIGDGKCNGGDYMTAECSNDGGDCAYCKVQNNTLVGNAKCNGGEYNVEACDYDGGDCNECNKLLRGQNLSPGKIGDGVCNGGNYTMDVCNKDGGDCEKCRVSQPFRIGDGVCDMDYNTPECSHDGGDCLIEGFPDCYVLDSSLLGDKTCHGGNYTSEECGLDKGDCKHFIETYPNCTVPEPYRVGDNICDAFNENSMGQPLYNTASCNYDGGDCDLLNENITKTYPNCTIVAPVEIGWIGNGDCNSELNVVECGFDGGDCDTFNAKYPNCTATSPWLLFDFKCDGILPHNTAECGWDGGACNVINARMREKYPRCNSQSFGLLANDRCDISLNTADCGWDNDKCREFTDKYPFCKMGIHTLEPWKVGDGHCDFVRGSTKITNQETCDYDGGDCLEFNKKKREKFPNCTVDDNLFVFIDDAKCHLPLNTEECEFDGGDCDNFNANYTECNTTKPFWIGDGHCNPELNYAECKYDGGDCEDFNKNYSECKTDIPYLLGDGRCDEPNNNPECGYDDGDCL